MQKGSSSRQPPRLGPAYPLYPAVWQLVLVQGPESRGGFHGNLMQQSEGALRPREAVYVLSLGTRPLVSGMIYLGRLVGAFTGSAGPLPLLAVACNDCS